jgi:hypothetical protein
MPVSTGRLRKIYGPTNEKLYVSAGPFSAPNAASAGANEFFEKFTELREFVALKGAVNTSMNVWARLHSGMF